MSNKKFRVEDASKTLSLKGNFKSILGVILLLGGLLGAGVFLDARQMMIKFLSWCEANVEQHPISAPIVYILFLAVWTAACLPTTICEILPGFLFGMWKGVAVQLLGKYLGNAIAITIGRYFLRDFVRKYVFDKFHTMYLIERVIARGGFKMVVLVRGCFVPMLIKNYGLAVMDIPFVTIMLGGLVTGVPYAFTRVYVGTLAVSAKSILEGDSANIKELILGQGSSQYYTLPLFVIGTGILLWFSKYMNSLWKQIMAEEQQKGKKVQ